MYWSGVEQSEGPTLCELLLEFFIELGVEPR